MLLTTFTVLWQSEIEYQRSKVTEMRGVLLDGCGHENPCHFGYIEVMTAMPLCFQRYAACHINQWASPLYLHCHCLYVINVLHRNDFSTMCYCKSGILYDIRELKQDAILCQAEVTCILENIGTVNMYVQVNNWTMPSANLDLAYSVPMNRHNHWWNLDRSFSQASDRYFSLKSLLGNLLNPWLVLSKCFINKRMSLCVLTGEYQQTSSFVQPHSKCSHRMWM